MTYEDLVKVNGEIKTVDVKGKAYAEVNERILAFRKLYPEGYITTRIISVDGGVVIIRAEVGNDGKELGSGIAYEREGNGFINTTSYIENCETSAVGRALGMLGIGITTSVASAEEVQNAILQQEAKQVESKKVTTAKVNALKTKAKAESVEISKICDLYKVKDLADLTERQYSNIIKHWSEIVCA